MKLAKLLLILATCSLSSAALAAEPQNNGQGFKVDTSKLDKADPFKARRQLQIIDESPIVNDLRRPAQGPNNIILNIQPLPQQAGSTTVINVGSPGGGQPGAAGSAPPGSVVIDANRLGDASRIPSNMNALRNPTGLAPGQTTNRLGNSGAGTVNGTLKPPGPGQQAVARQAGPGQQAGGPQQIKMVNTGSSSVTSSNNMRTTVSTSAQLLHNKQAAAAATKK